MRKKNKDESACPIQRFDPDYNSGLTEEQVLSRREQGLVNSVKRKYSKSYTSIIIGNVCTFFNLLGLLVFIALLLVHAKLFDYVFVIVYIANISIGIIQEIRAKKSIDKLSLITNKCSVVIRDGNEINVSPQEIVLDDVIKLSLGNQIPTDCKIINGEVEVNESLLTGESVPIKKTVGDNLLSGSFISSGNCYVKSEKVGKDNYVETLTSKAKKYRKPHSELMESLHLLIKIIGAIIIPIALLYTGLKYFVGGQALKDAVLGTCTLVIGMIPSGMFLLTSLALAVGTIKLAKQNTMVQDLYSLEMLARVDTVCFDKTGTITDGHMTVKDIVVIEKKYDNDVKKIISSMNAALKDDNQTSSALIESCGNESYYSPVKTLNFNSKRKLSAVTFNDIGTFAFGAPEFILSKKDYDNISETINGYASQGLRVLIFAHSKTPLTGDGISGEFSPIAYILIVDTVRAEAPATVNWFKENDVAIKVISGDNPVTVSEVSKRVGIDNAENFISLEGLTDDEVKAAANKYTVFGRVSPEQKAILVTSLKAAGHTTAMTGDGVNDILALKEADCAITVASGSEAARNVSHIILMDNNFNSMPKVVYEGRRVVNNVQSSASLYLMKTLFTIILALITIFAVFKTYPFQLKQMNLLELFVIGIPSFFLSLQPNDSRIEGKFLHYVIAKSLPSAILMVSSVLIIELLKNVLGLFPNEISNETYVTMQVYCMTFAGLVNLFMMTKPLNLYRSVLLVSCSLFLLGAFIITVFRGISFLGLEAFIPLSKYWHHVLIVVAVTILNIPLSLILQKLSDVIIEKIPSSSNK